MMTSNLSWYKFFYLFTLVRKCRYLLCSLIYDVHTVLFNDDVTVDGFRNYSYITMFLSSKSSRHHGNQLFPETFPGDAVTEEIHSMIGPFEKSEYSINYH